MRILAAYDVFSGCTWYRLVLPLHAAEEAGHEVRISDKVTRAEIEWCDVLVVQRLWQPDALLAVERANSLGKLTIYDLDDDLWGIGPENSAFEFWIDHARLAERVIRSCALVTTTCEDLAAVLRQFNPNVRIVPNALAADWKAYPRPHEGVVIGWAGSKTHKADILSVKDALLDTLDEFPHVTLEMACEHLGWIDHERIVNLKTVPIERYHQLLSRFDIGIAPLTDTPFNRCKSDLKVQEYAGVGIPFVCSSVGPYKGCGRSGAGYEARSYASWRKHLSRLIQDASLRQQMGARGLEWARRLSSTLPLWEDAWTSERSSPSPTRRRKPSSEPSPKSSAVA